MALKLPNLLAFLILCEWGGIFIYFYLSGRISAFLHSYYQPWVIVAGVLMIVAAAVILLCPSESCHHHHEAGENCAHDHAGEAFAKWNWRKWGHLIVLVLPLAIVALFTPDRFGEVLLQNRRALTTAAQLPGTYKPGKLPVLDAPSASFPDHAYNNQFDDAFAEAERATAENITEKSKTDMDAPFMNITDLIYVADNDTLREEFEGKWVAVIGQLDIQKGRGNFNVYQLLMQCCAADAIPISMRVDYEDLSPGLKTADWICVKGKIHFVRDGGSFNPTIDAADVSSTPADANPFAP